MVEEENTEILNGTPLTLQPTTQLSFDDAINDDLFCQIYMYASIDMLLIAPQINRKWKKNTDNKDAFLWEPSVSAFWVSKTYNQPSEKVLKERVKSLPLRSLKLALNRVDISRCVEKPDFQNMVIARLIFGDRSPIKRQALLYYPEWALHIGDYKASYCQAVKDSRRTDITVTELCMIKWLLHFKGSDDDSDSPTVYKTAFYEDFSMITAGHGKLNWQFTEDGYGRQCIAVENYPLHTSTRLKNGQWRIDNEHVWFEQISSIDPDNVPLF
mmetsp:Transcript_25570/g.24449  ORF Transcript_25570/g.24449 Transcript_25570/m.24449 type:complete len:270 (-) Transcript_25570:113-922(-)|eukprot:CAMPEP_0119038424 /NCGR_PEP_ID=MMETSP1177-20130426/7368_1 /TAXON_ID=2985 /ORGANISM="Ochromonas sp, Strain CCMP1899" /LENGTH=269 /DNA_ID=CAMNT_0007001015 /DNA_START=182 /DNA_END=991 /DNA_ORIENTATION=+